MGAYAGYVVWGEGKHFVTYNGTIARPKDNSIDSKYGYYLLDSKKIYKICAGSGQPFVSYSDLNGIDILLPKDKDEQRLLAYYFTNLDHLITLHQRKICIFIKKMPIDWEQRKFSDVGSVAMCKRIFKEQTSDEGEVPFYKIGTFGGIPDAFISRKLFDEYKTKYPYPNKGDILISASGSIGRTVEFTGKDEYFQDSNIVWLKHGDEIDNSFLKVLYSVVEWSCEGSTIKRLYNDNFLKTNFMLPKIDEQIKLGAYFSSLDHLITLHHRKCVVLRKKKVNDWEQRKVSDLLQERNEQASMSEEYPLMAFIANQGVAPKGERYDRSALVNDEAGKKYKRTKFGDFIYSSNNLETGSIGLNKYGNASISPVYSIFKPTGKADLDFLGRRFLRKDFINEMVKWRQGVVYGQWKIHETDFLNINVTLPSIDEQKEIGIFLDALDHLITLHHRE